MYKYKIKLSHAEWTALLIVIRKLLKPEITKQLRFENVLVLISIHETIESLVFASRPISRGPVTKSFVPYEFVLVVSALQKFIGADRNFTYEFNILQSLCGQIVNQSLNDKDRILNNFFCTLEPLKS